ncbi:hypothetical protein J4434_08010 [Candidatus Woesearchaeota archaeon]|nr:hypothetical protein [Candidatus Woesearchaeota archaeon]
MVNMCPALDMMYERVYKEESCKYDNTSLTLVFIISMLAVLFFGDWGLRFKMWGSLTILYFVFVS